MSDAVQFAVEDAGGFYVTVAEGITVYEAYADAVADIQRQLQADADGFLAEVAIDGEGDTDDVAVTLEQVSWQQIIRDLPDDESEPTREDDGRDETREQTTTETGRVALSGDENGDD